MLERLGMWGGATGTIESRPSSSINYYRTRSLENQKVKGAAWCPVYVQRRELVNSEWAHLDSGASQGMDRTCHHRGPPSISCQASALRILASFFPQADIHMPQRLSENSEWLLPLSCQNGLQDLVTVGPHAAHAGMNPGRGGTGGGNNACQLAAHHDTGWARQKISSMLRESCNHLLELSFNFTHSCN